VEGHDPRRWLIAGRPGEPGVDPIAGCGAAILLLAIITTGRWANSTWLVP